MSLRNTISHRKESAAPGSGEARRDRARTVLPYVALGIGIVLAVAVAAVIALAILVVRGGETAPVVETRAEQAGATSASAVPVVDEPADPGTSAPAEPAPTTAAPVDSGLSSVDYASPFEIIDLRSDHLAGVSPSDEQVLLLAPIEGTDGQGCEGIGSMYDLVTADVAGTAIRTPVIGGFMGHIDAYVGPGGSVAIVNGCDGSFGVTGVGTMAPDGALEVVRPQLPADIISIVGEPIWASDGASFIASFATGNGLENVRITTAGELVSREAAHAILIAVLSDGSFVETTNGVVTVGGEVLIDGLGFHVAVGAASDSAAGRVAIYGDHGIFVASVGSDEVRSGYSERPVIDAAWNADGVLAFLTEGGPATVFVADPAPSSGVTKVDADLLLAHPGRLAWADNGRAIVVGGLSGTGEEQVVLARFDELAGR